MRSAGLGAIGSGLALTLVALGCAGGDVAEQPVDTAMGAPAAAAVPDEGAATGAGSAALTSVADIAGDPQRFAGQTVTVEGKVDDVHSAFAFALDEDAPVAGGVDNDLLVFSPSGGAQIAEFDDTWDNTRVRVTGVVHQLGVVEVERETGWDLDPELEAELEQVRPVVIATSVERIGGG